MRTPATIQQRSAFSLIEVALAMAVLSFGAIGILSLTSSGLGQYRQVMDTTVAAQIAQRMVSDAEQADFKVLTDARVLRRHPQVVEVEEAGGTFSFRAPAIEAPAFRYFDEQGKEIVAEDGRLSAGQKQSAVYWVNMRVAPRAGVPLADGHGSELARVTVEVACNPAGIDLATGSFIETDETSPRWNLFKPPMGVRVITHSAYVGPKE